MVPRRAVTQFALVAIPANDEAERIGRCLAALSMQRDGRGAPLPSGSFEILVFANNCRDATVDIVAAAAADSPHPIRIVAEALPPERSNAGWARKRAMDLAAQRLSDLSRSDGLILTTDADSVVGPTWISSTQQAIARGADCVAGYVDADPAEMMRLGGAFVQRGRLEDRYMSAVAHLYALADPRSHDPWPNHRVSAGASLAVTLAAYRAIGGLPVRAVGEDAALTAALDDAGFRVRHAMDVVVTTSCRFEGRVDYGAAETMRHRHANLDAPCDGDLEPALATLRRALYQARLRRVHAAGGFPRSLALRLGLAAKDATELASPSGRGFGRFWQAVIQASPILKATMTLTPADLPREIRRAELCIRLLERAQARAGA